MFVFDFSFILYPQIGITSEEILFIQDDADHSISPIIYTPLKKLAEFDSEWIDMPEGTKTVLLSLRGDPEDFVVDLQARELLGDINQINYGANTFQFSSGTHKVT